MVVGLEGDVELGHLDLEQLEQLSLLGGQDLALLADTVLVGQSNNTVVQHSGHAQTPELRLHVVGEDLLAAVDGASGDDIGAGGLDTGASEIRLGVISKEFLDLLGLSVGEEQADVADELLGELMQVVLVLVLGAGAQSLGHNLGAAKEEAGGLHLGADGLQVGVAHVLDGEDPDVLVDFGALSDLCVG